jgi:hypothetical protein
MEKNQLPNSTQITKLFLSSDVSNLKQEFLSVRSIGSTSTEELLEGLAGRRKSHEAEALEWETWEAQHGQPLMVIEPPKPQQPAADKLVHPDSMLLPPKPPTGIKLLLSFSLVIFLLTLAQGLSPDYPSIIPRIPLVTNIYSLLSPATSEPERKLLH